MHLKTLLAALLLTPAVASASQIPNGDFELNNGTSYWSVTSTTGHSVISNMPGLNNAAYLGGFDNEVTSISQTVTELDYDMTDLIWEHNITSNEPCGPEYDMAWVVAHTPSSGWQYTEIELCNPGGIQLFWTAGVLPISGNAHETLTILVVSQTDVSVPSTIVFDNFETQ